MSEAMTPAMLAVQQEMEALHARNEELRKALEFYAEEENWRRFVHVGRHWSNGTAMRDRGSRARATLFGLEDR